ADAPDAARGSGVEVTNALAGELLGAAGVIFEVRVAAVDDDVSTGEQAGSLLHGALGGVAGGHHQPHRAGRLELLDQLFERAGGYRAFTGELLHRVHGAVVHHHLVPALHQPAHHVRAHAAQANHSDLHVRDLPLIIERASV